jgi:hypothetical protein
MPLLLLLLLLLVLQRAFTSWLLNHETRADESGAYQNKGTLWCIVANTPLKLLLLLLACAGDLQWCC